MFAFAAEQTERTRGRTALTGGLKLPGVEHQNVRALEIMGVARGNGKTTLHRRGCQQGVDGGHWFPHLFQASDQFSPFQHHRGVDGQNMILEPDPEVAVWPIFKLRFPLGLRQLFNAFFQLPVGDDAQINDIRVEVLDPTRYVVVGLGRDQLRDHVCVQNIIHCSTSRG